MGSVDWLFMYLYHLKVVCMCKKEKDRYRDRYEDTKGNMYRVMEIVVRQREKERKKERGKVREREKKRKRDGCNICKNWNAVCVNFFPLKLLRFNFFSVFGGVR